MSRQYAAIKLLEHGALTAVQMHEITGWPKRSVHGVLWHLAQQGVIFSLGRARLRTYGLA